MVLWKTDLFLTADFTLNWMTERSPNSNFFTRYLIECVSNKNATLVSKLNIIFWKKDAVYLPYQSASICLLTIACCLADYVWISMFLCTYPEKSLKGGTKILLIKTSKFMNISRTIRKKWPFLSTFPVSKKLRTIPENSRKSRTCGHPVLWCFEKRRLYER